MKNCPRLSLVGLFALATATPAQAGFLDAVVNAGAGIAAASAAPQPVAAQIEHAQIERLADELMTSLGVPAKTKQAKRGEVIRKLEALVMSQQPLQGVPAASLAGAGGGNQAVQLAQAMSTMQQGGGTGGALAMLGGAGGGTSKAMQLVAFLAENPDLLSQIKGMAKDGGSGVDLTRTLNAAASRMAAKNPKGAQVVKFMADNPELTRQALSLAGSSLAGTGEGLMGSLKGMFSGSGGGDSAPAAKPADQAAGGSEGGFFGGLKGMLQNAEQGNGGGPASPGGILGGESGI